MEKKTLYVKDNFRLYIDEYDCLCSSIGYSHEYVYYGIEEVKEWNRSQKNIFLVIYYANKYSHIVFGRF